MMDMDKDSLTKEAVEDCLSIVKIEVRISTSLVERIFARSTI